ncbi:AlbA-2 domain-containing protein [Fusobacterium necrophorum subsp. funduliforme]
MNSKVIKHFIQNGEKIDVEFKESKNALTKDVFDTVCSFNNRNGGHILLGVNDKREIVGVSKDKVDKVIKEFTTACNNPQKIYPPLYLIPEVFDVDEKKVIYIRVPEGFRYAEIMEEFGIGLMKEISISQIIQNLYISYMQENRVVIL